MMVALVIIVSVVQQYSLKVIIEEPSKTQRRERWGNSLRTKSYTQTEKKIVYQLRKGELTDS
jgi:hypothetical protein